MEEKTEFPKSAKEFYDELVARNKLNAVKITKEAVDKLYQFLLEVKGKNNYLIIYASVEYSNDKDENKRKGTHQIYGTCLNCGNILSDTGGKHDVRQNIINPSGIQHGRYCLKCGKIYLKEGWRSDTFTEGNSPLFNRTVMKY